MGSVYHGTTEIVFTDHQINGLVEERKVADGDLYRGVGYKEHAGHRNGSVQLKGQQTGSKFEVKLRQAVCEARNFSVILGVFPQGRSNLFILRRYNIHTSAHSNPIEGTEFEGLKPHIHKATERYQRKEDAEPEHYAELTDRFSSFEEAISCLVDDCGIVSKNGDQPELFGWRD